MNTLEEVMLKYPRLTTNGFMSPQEAKFGEYRSYLASSHEDVERARRFMLAIPKTKTIRRNSSYHIKHIVENATKEYISNGCLIAGALLAGFNISGDWHINCSFNIARKDIDRLAKQHGPYL